MVSTDGLEPSRFYAAAFKAAVSTNSTTWRGVSDANLSKRQ